MFEVVTLAITIGALLSRTFSVSIHIVLIIAGAVVICAFVYFKTLRGMVFGIAVGGALVLGAFVMESSEHVVPGELYGARAFDASVVSVDRRLTYSNVVVMDTIHEQKVQVSTSRLDLLPGDMITVRGNVQAPEDFLTDTGRLFPYREYLESKGIVARVSFAQVVIVEKGAWSLTRFATVVRFGIADTFAKYVSFPTDGIVSGMLVGYQGGIPDETEELFRTTGVLHVLVLSGYNIMLLAGFLALLLRSVPFKIRTVLTVLVIILLVMVSGSGVASIRAGIMGSIALFAGVVRRTYQPLRGLLIAYLIFFFISPHTIFIDPGFHLSFLATLFMILVLPSAQNLFTFIPVTRGVNIRELIVLAISAPLFMLPYMLYFSGLVPMATVPANIALAVLIPVIMALGIGLLALAWIPFVATFLGIFLSLLGSITLWLLHLFNRLPIANLPAISWWVVIAIYGVGIGILFRKDITSYSLQLRSSFRRRTSAAAP